MGATGSMVCKADSSVVVPVHDLSYCSIPGTLKCTKSLCSDGDMLISVPYRALSPFARAASHTFMLELVRLVLVYAVDLCQKGYREQFLQVTQCCLITENNL